MALSWTDLKAYVNAPTADDDFVEQCWTEAIALVTKFVGTATVPATITDRARIEVGQELYSRRAAPNGIANTRPLRVLVPSGLLVTRWWALILSYSLMWGRESADAGNCPC